MKVIKFFLYLMVALVMGILSTSVFATSPTKDTEIPAGTLSKESQQIPEDIIKRQIANPEELIQPELYRDNTKEYGLDLEKISFMERKLRERGIGKGPITLIRLFQGIKKTHAKTLNLISENQALFNKFYSLKSKKNTLIKLKDELTQKRENAKKEKRKHLKAYLSTTKEVQTRLDTDIKTLTPEVAELKKQIDALGDPTAILVDEQVHENIENISEAYGITEAQAMKIPALE